VLHWTASALVAGLLMQAPSPVVLPASQLPLTLVGVAVGEAGPSASVCMIRCAYPSAETASTIYRVGARACDVAEVTDIQADAVVIRNLVTNRLERLSLHGAGAPTVAPTAAAALAIIPSVVKKSPNNVTVDVPKAAVDHYLLNLSDLLTSALATPHFRSAGVMDGFQLGEIKAGSVVEQLGLRNGDIITDVNGEALDSFAAVMRLAGQAQTITQAKMTVLRSGKPMTFVFNTK
jgi:type II secretory pathway component PulC